MVKYPIYLITMQTQYLLASTFMRFQEYYESPKFRKKIFTREEYEDWYALEGCPRESKNFTYYQDWDGFNVPSWVLRPFYDGAFDPLSCKEKKLLDACRHIAGTYYVIGVSEEALTDISAVKHEFVHGLYYTNPEYGNAVRSILRKYDVTYVREILRSMGYNEDVLDDEINAYFTTGLGPIMDSLKEGYCLGRIERGRYIKPLQKELRGAVRECLGTSIVRASEDLIRSRLHELQL